MLQYENFQDWKHRWVILWLSCSSQMRDIKCSSHGRFKAKPITLAFVASALYT